MMGSTARSSSAPGSDVLTPTRLKTVRARTGELPSVDKWIVSRERVGSIPALILEEHKARGTHTDPCGFPYRYGLLLQSSPYTGCPASRFRW